MISTKTKTVTFKTKSVDDLKACDLIWIWLECMISRIECDLNKSEIYVSYLKLLLKECGSANNLSDTIKQWLRARCVLDTTILTAFELL